MLKTIISDTSCLIILSKIGELDLLQKVYGQIITTNEIAQEFGENLPDWIDIEFIEYSSQQRLLETQVDKGEASAIALALQLQNCTLILDDLKARKIAQKLNISCTGTIGVIIKAKLTGKIDSVITILSKIKNTDFRISEQLYSQALKEADE